MPDIIAHFGHVGLEVHGIGLVIARSDRRHRGPSLGAAPLTPTSYLVLGLVTREGASTPYDLKRHVAAMIGHFWSFPHALLYKEPARLVELGLLTEERELDGRRRRRFTITNAGRQALREWLRRPARQPTELRDLGLLQLFFADLEPTTATLAIAQASSGSSSSYSASCDRWSASFR